MTKTFDLRRTRRWACRLSMYGKSTSNASESNLEFWLLLFICYLVFLQL